MSEEQSPKPLDPDVQGQTRFEHGLLTPADLARRGPAAAPGTGDYPSAKGEAGNTLDDSPQGVAADATLKTEPSQLPPRSPVTLVGGGEYTPNVSGGTLRFKADEASGKMRLIVDEINVNSREDTDDQSS